MNAIHQWLKRTLEYQGEGAWIYTRKNLQWVDRPLVVSQLPNPLRIFAAYVRLHNALVGTRTILLGHGVYKFLRRFGATSASFRLRIDGGTVWLDMRDPGALHAMNELAVGSELTRLAEQEMSAVDLFVDVGANQGIFTFLAIKATRPGSTIVSIEPQPPLAHCLEQTLGGSGRTSWRVVRGVVTDSPGKAQLSVPDENRGEAHLSSSDDTGALLDVEATTLDDVLHDVPAGTRAFVKIDVEGAERNALLGGRDFFRRCKPAMLLELNPAAMDRFGYQLSDLRLVLASLGYSHWAPAEDPKRRFPLINLPEEYSDVLLTAGNA